MKEIEFAGHEELNEVSPGKKSLLKRVLEKVMTPERKMEFFVAQIMMGLELKHEMMLHPAKFNLNFDQVGKLPTDPMAAWAVDHIGDIWEISAGHTALRLGFVAVNEVLKKVGNGKEIPDEACFWASLITIVTVKAVHSLGYITLFHINDHMDNPVPGMLFGQAVAAVVLAVSHYTAKYHESIKDLAIRAGAGVVGGAVAIDKQLNELITIDDKDVALDIVADSEE